MKHRRSTRFVAVLCMLLLFVPQVAEASRLFAPRAWTSRSVVLRPRLVVMARGIGGLQAEIGSRLSLREDALSFRDGALVARVGSKKLVVSITGVELAEAVHIVRSSDAVVLQTSLDDTAGGRRPFVDPALEGTTLGQLLMVADLEFAAMVQQRRDMPDGAPEPPYAAARALLEKDKRYRDLTMDWPVPPLSWPQIYITFQPKSPEGVEFEFRPQVIFQDNGGAVVEPSAAQRAVARKPYLGLIQDVKRRVGAYRGVLPAVDRAASAVAALGLVRAACRKPDSCTALLRAALGGMSDEDVLRGAFEAIRKRNQALDEGISVRTEVPELDELHSAWHEARVNALVASMTFGAGDSSWARAYDLLSVAARETLAATGTSTAESKRRQVQTFENLANPAMRQFTSHPVPDDALLLAAAAVAYGFQGRLQEAGQKLQRALDLSAANPGDRIIVSEWGLMLSGVYSLVGDKEGERLATRMTTLRNDTLVSAFDAVSEYLDGCIAESKQCSLDELREWQTDATRAGLSREVPGREVAWLFGRFAYAVGMKAPRDRARDRLRELQQYGAAVSSAEHRSRLASLEAVLRARVGR